MKKEILTGSQSYYYIRDHKDGMITCSRWWKGKYAEYYVKLNKDSDVLFDIYCTRTKSTVRATLEISLLSMLSNDWLVYTPPVLDLYEARYLRSVITPFKEAVKAIVKCEQISNNGKVEFIKLIYTNGISASLPFFKAGTLYRAMEVNKEYTIERLDL